MEENLPAGLGSGTGSCHTAALFKFIQFKTFSFLSGRSYDLSDELDVNTVCYHANETFGRCQQLPMVGCLVSTVTNYRNSGGYCVPPSFNLFKLRYLLHSGFILCYSLNWHGSTGKLLTFWQLLKSFCLCICPISSSGAS